MREALRRADHILARAKARGRTERAAPRHALKRPPTIQRPPSRTRRATTITAGVLGLALTGGGIVWAAADDQPAPAAAVATDCPAPTVTQTDRYLAELELAGVPLPTPQTREAAAHIGRTHVAHCHLIGMRWQIERDLREQIPGLTAQQIVDARVAVEHHFLDVTGRKQ